MLYECTVHISNIIPPNLVILAQPSIKILYSSWSIFSIEAKSSAKSSHRVRGQLSCNSQLYVINIFLDGIRTLDSLVCSRCTYVPSVMPNFICDWTFPCLFINFPTGSCFSITPITSKTLQIIYDK